MSSERFYSVAEVCALFDIHEATLRRWRRGLGLTSWLDPCDRRRLMISSSELVALSKIKKRVFINVGQELSATDVLLTARMDKLAGRVEELAKLVEKLLSQD